MTRKEYNRIVDMIQSSDEEIVDLGISLLRTKLISEEDRVQKYYNFLINRYRVSIARSDYWKDQLCYSIKDLINER